MGARLSRWLSIAGVMVVLLAGSARAQSGAGSAELFEWAEWSVSNSSWGGNPFDLDAEVNFTHVGSGETRTTQMFYDGGTDWKFRFTGTQTGTWNYTTSSGDGDLDGLSGSINVTPNSNPNAYGFVTNVGNKWARQKSSGGVEAFVPHFRMGFEKSGFNWSSSEIDGRLNDWMGSEGFNGAHVFMAGYWTDRDVGGAKFKNQDPDLRSFNVLEDMIGQVRDRGGVTHIWYCGDTGRQQSAESAFGTPGAATTGEQRLLEYIGDRLSPVPGWIMGYGYDNPEHVNTSQLQGWGNYLRDHMAYEHLLGARDQGGNINYTFWPEADFYSRGHWFSGVSYQDLADAIDSNTSKLHSFDERWYRSRLGSEEDIRRQLWLCNMAGGVSAIFGNEGDWERDPYDNPEYFETAFTFWADRFKADMVRDNALTGGPGDKQYALRSDADNLVVIYGEGTNDIDVNLSHLSGDADWSGGARIVAVNTKQNYAEVDLGTYALTDGTLNLGSKSDWALAIQPASDGNGGGNGGDNGGDNGGGTPPGSAHLMVYEGFNYNSGEGLLGGSDWNPSGGKDGGTGWAEAWQGDTGRQPTVADGLTYPDVPVGGGSAYKADRMEVQRKLGSEAMAAVTGNNTVWFSFLLEPGENKEDMQVKFYGPYHTDPSWWYDRGIGVQADKDDGDPATMTISPELGNNKGDFIDAGATGTTSLIVGKIVFGTQTGDDIDTSLTVWANPDVAAGEGGLSGGTSISGIVDLTTTDFGEYFFVRGGGSSGGSVDEIRLGNTFGDVVVPEPATLSLLALGALSVLARRRRSA